MKFVCAKCSKKCELLTEDEETPISCPFLTIIPDWKEVKEK